MNINRMVVLTIALEAESDDPLPSLAQFFMDNLHKKLRI